MRRPKRTELKDLNLPNPEEVRANVGAQIAKARGKKGITQTELAKRVGISVKTIQHVEHGRNYPSLPVYIVICRVLGIECGAGV